MRIPTAYNTRCPDCGRATCITINDAWATWLPDTEWKCPYCKKWRSTDSIVSYRRSLDRRLSGSTRESRPVLWPA